MRACRQTCILPLGRPPPQLVLRPLPDLTQALDHSAETGTAPSPALSAEQWLTLMANTAAAGLQADRERSCHCRSTIRQHAIHCWYVQRVVSSQTRVGTIFPPSNFGACFVSKSTCRESGKHVHFFPSLSMQITVGKLHGCFLNLLKPELGHSSITLIPVLSC